MHDELFDMMLREHMFTHLIVHGTRSLAIKLREELWYAPFDHVPRKSLSTAYEYELEGGCGQKVVENFKHYHMCMKLTQPHQEGDDMTLHMMLIGEQALADFVFVMMQYDRNQNGVAGRHCRYDLDFNHVGALHLRQRLEARVYQAFSVSWFCVDDFTIHNMTDPEASQALIERVKTRKSDNVEDVFNEVAQYQAKGKLYLADKEYRRALREWRMGDRLLAILSNNFQNPSFQTDQGRREKARYIFQQNNNRTCALLGLARSSDQEVQLRGGVLYTYAVHSVRPISLAYRASDKDLGMAWYRKSKVEKILHRDAEAQASLEEARALLHPDEFEMLQMHDGAELHFDYEAID